MPETFIASQHPSQAVTPRGAMPSISISVSISLQNMSRGLAAATKPSTVPKQKWNEERSLVFQFGNQSVLCHLGVKFVHPGLLDHAAEGQAVLEGHSSSRSPRSELSFDTITARVGEKQPISVHP